MSIVDPEKSLDNNQENNHHQQSAGSTSTTTIANSNNSSNKSKNNVVNGNGANPEDVQSTIRDYFEVLQRYVISALHMIHHIHHAWGLPWLLDFP